MNDTSIAPCPPTLYSRRMVLIEVLFIFLLFFIHGAWPAPEVNEVHYLCKAKHYWNPEWLRRDFFLSTADAHLTFYWVFGWLTLFFPLPVAAWIGRLFSWTAIAWAWQRVSRTIVPRPWWTVLSAGLWLTLMARCHLAGEWVIGGIEAKVLAFVPALLGIADVILGRWKTAWMWFGLVAAFHVLIGGWLVVATAFTWLITHRKSSGMLGEPSHNIRNHLWGLAVGGTLSLFGLVPALLLEFGADPSTITQANGIYVFQRLPHHLYPPSFTWELMLRFILLVVVWWWLAGRVRSPAGERRLTSLVNGALAVSAVGLLISLVAPFDLVRTGNLLKFYWFRLTDVLLPLGVALLITRSVAGLVISEKRRGTFLLIVCMGMITLHESFVIYYRLQLRRPSVDDKMVSSADWQEICAWIRGNTPAHAVFLTPRRSASFHWFAERAEVATHKDVPQDPVGIVRWWERLSDVHARTTRGNINRWRESYAFAEPSELVRLGHVYGADYIVTEAIPPLPFELVNPPNPTYAVYRLPKTVPPPNIPAP